LRLKHWLVMALVACHPGSTLVSRAAEPRPGPLPLNAPLSADLTTRIAQGEAAFRVQNYGKVVDLLDRLAGHPLLEGRPEHLRVLEMLGASHWFMSSKDSARLIFGQLLREAPFQHFDEFVYPPELIAFFETRRRELVTAGIIPATPTDVNTPRRMLVREVHEDDTPGVVFLAPFGIGQFINDQDGKGTAMAIIQGLGAATMIASTIGIETLKVGDSNRIIAEDNGKQARFLNALWYGGMVVLTATWAYSIIDGFANRNTAPIIEERYELIEPAPKSAGPPPVDDGRARDVTLRLAPGPGDLGLGLSLGF